MSNIDVLQRLSGQVRAGVVTRNKLQDKVISLNKDIIDNNKKIETMVRAKQLLSVVSDDTLNATVEYITSVINKVLADIFENTGNQYTIQLHKELYRGRYTHVTLELYEDGFRRDFKISSGMGIRQVISFLYTICLIEESGKRKFIILDEVLSNLNHEAAEAVGIIIKIFVENGFQILMIDHGNYNSDSLLDSYIQRVHIQKIDKVSTVVSSDTVLTNKDLVTD